MDSTLIISGVYRTEHNICYICCCPLPFSPRKISLGGFDSGHILRTFNPLIGIFLA